MTNKATYRGIIVPMVTPFNQRGSIDEASERRIVSHIVSSGCAVFVAGTTGESSSITDDRKVGLVRIAVEANAGRNLVYAGIADNAFDASLAKARLYKDLGADAAVAHVPWYYAIDEEQTRDWFLRLADECPLPLLLYNMPVTTGHSMSVAFMDELSRHENIVGAKDSERGDDRLAESLASWSSREDFTFHLGWAAMTSWGLQHGMDGGVPSSANLVPDLYRGIYDAVQKGDMDEADRLQAITNEISDYYQLGQPLSRSIPMFKAMLSEFGLCGEYVAPPMLTLAGSELDRVRRETRERFGEFVTCR